MKKVTLFSALTSTSLTVCAQKIFYWPLMLVILVSGFVFTGCSSDDDEKFDQTLILGSWSNKTVKIEGETSVTMEVTYSFYSNGTASQRVYASMNYANYINDYVIEDETNYFIYIYHSNSTITFTNKKGESWTDEITISGKKMRLGNAEDGYWDLTKVSSASSEIPPRDELEVEAVDLGLSVKWAACNVGASTPEEYGDYYAWGETDEMADSYEYKDINIGTNISATQYDVARIQWGGNWRMPTLSEINELINNCSWGWTFYKGVYGQLVTGPNGNSIFLPAAGYRYGTKIKNEGSHGYYWSATLNNNNNDNACHLGFYKGNSYWDNDVRSYGHTVRPVKK